MLSCTVFNQQCSFVTSVVNPDQLFAESLPEFAFIGRSNVGKSSLINALVNRKNLVKVSNTPGRTQAINYFNLADKLFLVDLPGYGYAKVPLAEKRIWLERSHYYLYNRASLKLLFLLIDSRHGITNTDLEFIAKLDTLATPYQIILTKCDKGKKLQLLVEDIKENFTRYHVNCLEDIICTSATKKQGLDDIRQQILYYINNQNYSKP